MLNIDSLLAYISLVLCGSLAQSQGNTRTVCLLEDPSDQFCPTAQSKLDRLDASVKETLSKLKTSLESKESRLDKLETGLKNIENQQTDILEKLNSIVMSITIRKFELIGSRYFYIENNIKQRWKSAESTCRQMGGHLAEFRDEKELMAIKDRLETDLFYWLGINDLDKKGHYVSVATGRGPALLKWSAREPVTIHSDQHCVLLNYSKYMNGMFLFGCNNVANFICQADNEV